MLKLRPPQAKGLQASKEKYAEGISRQLLVLPTGVGKTICFACLLEHHGITGRMLVLVHREELAQQAADKILRWNHDYSVGIEMGPLRSSRSDRVVVGSVQTLGHSGLARLESIDPGSFDAVIIDEAHHATANTYKAILNRLGLLGKTPEAKTLLLGVTATPSRGDGQALAQIFDEIIYSYSMLDAIRDGWLVPMRGYRIRSDVKLDGVHTVAGDFNQGELSNAINNNYRNGLIVREWKQKADNRRTICFTVDIAHAKQLAATFVAAGISAEAVWGNDPDRAAKLEDHRAGRCRVLTNCGVLTEGYDDPGIGCVVLARPTKSQLLFVQMAGRGARLEVGIDNYVEAKAAGYPLTKPDCLLLDITDNTEKHSLVTIASIFGLPPKLDLRGKTILEAVDEVQGIEHTNPGVDLSQCEDIDELKSHAEEVDLFSVKFPPEVLENSELQWMPTPKGNYILSLPNKEFVTISKDILNHWVVEGLVNGASFRDKTHTLPDAFAFADTMVKTLSRKLMSLMKRVVKATSWRDEPANQKQMDAIAFMLKVKGKESLLPLRKMTKGEAHKLLNKLGAERVSA